MMVVKIVARSDLDYYKIGSPDLSDNIESNLPIDQTNDPTDRSSAA